MKIVVIGAAPTAIGLAYRLNELRQTHPDQVDDVELLVLEQESFPGGLSRTVTDDKGFLWDMGGHITFSHNFPYYEEAIRWAVKEWNELQRHCLVDVNYVFGEKGIHLVPYPAQFAIPLFPEHLKKQCLMELKERYENPPKESPKTFEDWVLQCFGAGIFEIFFKPYTSKVWTVEPSKMSPTWVGTRVAKLPQKKLEELCSADMKELTKADFGWGPNAVFSFPRYGGTGSVWKSMAAKLPSRWFQYNSRVVTVDYKNRQLHYQLKGDQELKTMSYDALINTSPIDILVANTNICRELNLEHNKVFVVGVGLELPMPKWLEENKFSWLYFPDPAVPFFRVTFLSRYGELTPDNTKYWSVMCECARQPDDPASEEEIKRQCIEGLVLKTLIEEDKITTVFSTTLPYGYPIPTVQRDTELSRAHTVLESYSIYSRGRFGGWKYEVSNQDHCFMQGKEILDRLVFNEPEKVYKTHGPMEQRG